MGGLLLLLLLVVISGGEQEIKPECTPTQRAINTLKETLWYPIIHRLQFSAVPAPNLSSQSLPATPPAHGITPREILETPRSVFMIGLKLLTGVSLPLTRELDKDLVSLDYCGKIASIYEIEQTRETCPHTARQCQLLDMHCDHATFLVKIAMANLLNACFWWFIYGTVLTTFLGAITVFLCCAD